jgi:hypothetical protein
MNEPARRRRPQARLWQFSIANLLLLITLVAATCGAFRLSIDFGVLVVHLAILVAIVVTRTRCSVLHHEELWDLLDRPPAYRRSQAVELATKSLGVGLCTLFFFYVGCGIALVVGIIGEELIGMLVRNEPLRLFLSVVPVIIVFGSGILFSLWWLRITWPRTFFTGTASPSAKAD